MGSLSRQSHPHSQGKHYHKRKAAPARAAFRGGMSERSADVISKTAGQVVVRVVVEPEPELGVEVQVLGDLVLDARDDMHGREAVVEAGRHIVDVLERQVQSAEELQFVVQMRAAKTCEVEA